MGSGFDLQLHDFNPGITPNGVFWIVALPDDAVEIQGDSLIVNFKDVAAMDQIHFPGGTGNAPVSVTFEATYVKSGAPRRVRPTSHDPLSPFHWAGEMSLATNTGKFSVSYNDSSFSASGNFDSTGQFGEMGTERNGAFLEDRDKEEISAEADTSLAQPSPWNATASNQSNTKPSEALGNPPRLKGKYPLHWPLH